MPSRPALRLAAVLAALLTLLAASAAFAGEDFLRRMAAMGDRSPGTPGAQAAADAVAEEFRRLVPANTSAGETGRIIGRQSFRVPVVRSYGADLVLPEQGRIHIKQLRTNVLSPGAIEPPGLGGRLLYVGQGHLKDFNGLDPEGAVVLMDMDSGKNWNNAAVLGARALIFVGTGGGPTPSAFFVNKVELTPVDFPMFWISKSQAAELFGENVNESKPMDLGDVLLTSSAQWEQATEENVYCFMEGTDPALADQLLIVEAFYGSSTFVAGDSPGADESCSIATLMDVAETLGRKRPKRPVLLLASGAHAQAQAGMREFTWALVTKKKELARLKQHYTERTINAARALELLFRKEPLDLSGISPADLALLRNAYKTVVRNAEDDITSQLMRLRLLGRHNQAMQRTGKGHMRGKKTQNQDVVDLQQAIKKLAAERLVLKRLTWVQASQADVPLGEKERDVLARYTRQALEWQDRVLNDANARLGAVNSALELRKVMGGRSIAAHMSLFLSSHGKGVGGFDKGWLYDLKPDVNRTRFFSPIHDIFEARAKTLPKELKPLYHGTLRPSRLRTWESYLPDGPELGGEPMAIAGFPGFTLATVHDVRPAWGTPYDIPSRVNFSYFKRQSRLVQSLARELAARPIAEAGKRGKDRYTTLEGRANLLRKGELFPDKPGTDTVFLAFQWGTRMYGMVDTEGRFRIPGLADKKISYHKAVLEGMRFDERTGLAVWAVDKPKTGKDAYRVKLSRSVMETDMILFSCTQTTLFDMFDPRTFKYLYRPTLIDARTEAPPVSYWYSRLDTRSSTLGTLFLEPDVPIKLTLSDTVLDKKELLLNSTPENPLGSGYLARSWPTIPMTEFRAANDMWNLLTPRVKNLEQKGIVNERVQALAALGLEELQQARQYRAEKRWDRFMESARSSLAKASKVYNDVDKTQKDVLIGVLFYVALFVPFAYCMERLLFGFADIRKRIGAFLGLLAAIIAVVYMVHPAFELTYSPMVVILAFFILALSLLVSLIIFFRFEREMVELQRRSKHLKLSDISPAAAFTAAFVLGVSNLKRRPVRTFLTLATLVILTFTIMNFTTVKSVREKGWATFSPKAGYDGLLMKYFNWQDLPVEALSVVSEAYADKGVVAPRVWYDTGLTGDKSRAPLIPVSFKGKVAQLRGTVGLSHTEPRVSGLDRILVKGRWFRPGERHVVLLPERITTAIGADIGDEMTVWGVPYTLVGIFGDTGLRDNPDLDGEPITPIVYPNEAAVQLSSTEAEAIEEGEDVLDYQSRYQHIPGYETAILPAELLLSLGNTGKLKGLAVKQTGEKDLGTALGDRFGLMLFRGGRDGTSLFFTSDAVNYSGVANILIPLAISILIVLNTMIGSVYERRPEIAVYTSVGLAPPHVAFLFIAEALAFAVIAVVIGYLLAQLSAVALAGTALWAGMTANYSSTAGVAAMILVILVVLVSVLYPARVASRIAIPDVNRSWTMPKAEGDTLTVMLPFLINLAEQASAGGFLRAYYDTHHDVSHGAFSTADMACSYLDNEARKELGERTVQCLTPEQLTGEDYCFRMNLRVWLAPFDFGVRQKVDLTFCPSDLYRGYRQIRVQLTREAGEHKAWENLNRNFLNDLRKQLLAWRSLDEVAVQGYATDLTEHFAERMKRIEEAG
ncbi:FtsX-like permease family protein [Salidesulfovibrio onnuriiensis]|uniref:FtsX-like permease family protein n=1 Tax=Salidesulfovibrio onnuriiensis TaxID=2583823 RepID=UPI0011C83C05|nr:FtsX-like permease family protein [Salidesulfovibrio onnuriiensis]